MKGELSLSEMRSILSGRNLWAQGHAQANMIREVYYGYLFTDVLVAALILFAV